MNLENAFSLLQNLNNPQNQNFEYANKVISQYIMRQDQNFLKAILDFLLNVKIETNECFYALSIAKEYFKKSLVFDKFHDDFPSSSYTQEQISIFQNAAYRFFTSDKLFLRNNAVDLYVQAFKANCAQEFDIIFQMIDKLTKESTQFEELLSIMECLCLIFTELQMDKNQEKIFPILIALLNKFYERDEFTLLFFQLLSNFDHSVFHTIKDETALRHFFAMVIRFYQKNQLKKAIINFLQSPCLEGIFYCKFVEQLLPFFYEDLNHIASLSSDIGLSILNFFQTDLLWKYPHMIEIFLSQFLPVILNISLLFNLNNDPQFFIPDECDISNAAQQIIIELLTKPNTNTNFTTIIFNSILPFIQNGLLNEDLRFLCVSMNFLSYSMQKVPPEIINRSIPVQIVNQTLVQKVGNNSCRVRFYWMQLLSSCYHFYGIEIAVQFIDFLFKSVFDCETISLNAISLLVYIGQNPQFTLLDSYFAKIREIMCEQSVQHLINPSNTISNFLNVLIFPKTHHEYLNTVIQFIVTYLNRCLTFSDELVKSINRCVLHTLCSVLQHLIPLHFADIKFEDAKFFTNLSLSLYNRFLLGSDVFLLSYFVIKHPEWFKDQLKVLVELAKLGFANFEHIFSLPCFISFSFLLETRYDLSNYDLNFVVNLIQVFNVSQSIDDKKEILSCLALIVDTKPEIFTNQIINDSMSFFNDLSESVSTIFTSFLEESVRFYAKACSLYNLLITKTEFKSFQQSFFLVHQLIIHILDFDDLTDSIFEDLLPLFDTFCAAYKRQLEELMKEQPIYMEIYAGLAQKKKEFQEQSKS